MFPDGLLGTMTPFGENRGGTPMGERPLQRGEPRPLLCPPPLAGEDAGGGAEDTDQRLSAFRFPFSSCFYIRGLKH